MKIVYEGNNIAPHCTELHVAESFRALGHDVTFVPVTTSTTPELARIVAETKPDLFLLTRPWGTPPLATEKLLRRWEAEGVVTAGFHLDRFWGIPEREEWIAKREEPLFLCQHLFSTDGDHDAQWSEAGINHHWLPPGVLARECYDAEPDRQRWPYKVAFVGSAPTARGGNYHSEYPHRGELVAWLEKTYGRAFVHVGNGGTEPTQRGHDLNVLYASVDVVVGDSCFTHPATRYWSDRVPETWGRGGFLVHPAVRWLAQEFGAYPGCTWEAGDWGTLRATVDSWLGASDDRERVRKRIAARVRAHHTYTNRACEMLQVMGFDCQEEAA